MRDHCARSAAKVRRATTAAAAWTESVQATGTSAPKTPAPVSTAVAKVERAASSADLAAATESVAVHPLRCAAAERA